MNSKIQKWGNSLAIRIPKSFADELNVGMNSVVDLSIEDGKLVIQPEIAPEDRLDDLLAQVKSENLHGEVDSGDPVGREVW